MLHIYPEAHCVVKYVNDSCWRTPIEIEEGLAPFEFSQQRITLVPQSWSDDNQQQTRLPTTDVTTRSIRLDAAQLAPLAVVDRVGRDKIWQ